MGDSGARLTDGVGPDAAARVIAAILGDAGREGERAGLLSVEGYILSHKLGEGGGGAVYLGYREGSDRPLAIKVLAKKGGGPDGESKRAWRELELMQGLRLPCVPRVMDYGVSGGRMFIATEYVQGRPLDENCAGLTRRERVELLAKVADAVQSLHEHGVIHRDIKPANVLVDERGQVSIIDLGIATLLTGDVMATLTAEGAPIGSPAFMAPEQARGARAEISTRTDVYGLGAAAMVVLTGQTPFDCTGTIHEVLRRIGVDEPRGSRALDRTLPKPLGAVLDKATAGRAGDRYHSAGEMAQDLRRWLEGESVLAGGLSPWRRTLRWLGRHPLLATSAASALVALCIVGGAIAAAWWAGSHVATMVLDPEGGHWIEFRSYTGAKIRRWEAPERATLFAQQCERAKEFGGGTLFLIALGDTTGDPYANQLCAYAMSDPMRPAWSSGVGPPEIAMPTLHGFSARERFICTGVTIADVFPESPGVEIIATLRHERWGPTGVRIYDTGGHVLFEAWHNGWVNAVTWVPGPRLLALAAFNSEVTWPGRGVTGVQHVFPSVVGAIRPELGRRMGWIRTPTMAEGAPPLWYKCVLPPEAVDVLIPDVNLGPSVGPGEEPDTTFGLSLGKIVLWLDAKGEEVRSRRVDARYNLSGTMPDPRSVMHLGALPPIDPAKAVSARPAND